MRTLAGVSPSVILRVVISYLCKYHPWRSDKGLNYQRDSEQSLIRRIFFNYYLNDNNCTEITNLTKSIGNDVNRKSLREIVIWATKMVPREVFLFESFRNKRNCPSLISLRNLAQFELFDGVQRLCAVSFCLLLPPFGLFYLNRPICITESCSVCAYKK